MVDNLQNTEIEKAVLGAIMLDDSAYDKISEHFHLGLFTNLDFQNVAKVIIRLKNDGKKADQISVVNGLKKSDYLNTRFGAYEVASITDKVAGAGLLGQHTLMLKELFMKREVIRVSHETIQKAHAFNSDVFDVIDDAEKGISEITSQIVQQRTQSAAELFKRSIKRNQDILNLKGKLPGISTGFRKIDELLGGWQESRLTVLAGATSMGKTALALDFLLDPALRGIPVGMFSMEMSNDELFARLESKMAQVELNKINNEGIKDYDLQAFIENCKPLQEAPIHLDDSSGISIFQLKNLARNMKRRYGIKLLIIDYLQLMEGEKRGNREQEVATISRGLKGLAKELNIPIIALSQLSRKIEERADKEPKLSDLRESGAIEQDADTVCFVYRPEYYGITVSDSGESLVGKAKFFVKKNRHGPLGEVKLDFMGRFTKFQSEGIGSQSLSAMQPNYEF